MIDGSHQALWRRHRVNGVCAARDRCVLSIENGISM